MPIIYGAAAVKMICISICTLMTEPGMSVEESHRLIHSIEEKIHEVINGNVQVIAPPGAPSIQTPRFKAVCQNQVHNSNLTKNTKLTKIKFLIKFIK